MAWPVTATYELSLRRSDIGQGAISFYTPADPWWTTAIATYREQREPDEWGDPGRVVSRELIDALDADGRRVHRDGANFVGGRVVDGAKLLRPVPLCWDDAAEGVEPGLDADAVDPDYGWTY